MTVRRLQNIFRLGIKELRSLRHDTVLLLLVFYAFTYAIYSAATGTSSELRNASIAVVDEDRSLLSRRLTGALLKPYFREPQEILASEIDDAMDAGRYTFVVDIPPDFERDVLRGRQPQLQVNIDATAMLQAGAGARYIQGILSGELLEFVYRTGTVRPGRAAFHARQVQPQPDKRMVRQRDGTHQQRHHAGHDYRRRRADSGTRTRHRRASSGDAAAPV